MNSTQIAHTSLADGTVVPVLGQGSWHMGDERGREKAEIAALRCGIELGMTLIDTAEMYGEGRAESLIGKAIQGLRDSVFLVSKVYPHHAGGAALQRSCEASLRRLQVECLDLYLLHWPGSIPYEETIAGMEKLIAAGKIRRWGVSNLDMREMRRLQALAGSEQCMVNQLLYHLGSRGIEFDLLPWQRQRKMALMAYCPLAQAGRLRTQLLQDETVLSVAEELQATPLQVLLAWVIRDGDVIAIPKASSVAHVQENAAAAALTLNAQQRARLDNAFPPPHRATPLDIV